ncbi:WG repeat-containing protein, partial [Nostoc sp. NIES-2111]
IADSGMLNSYLPVGSRGYAPAEQVQGKPRFNSDIYALGITAIQALTGIDNPMQLPKNENCEIVLSNIAISEPLAQILTKMVSYDFRHRYSTAVEALHDLNLNVIRLLPSLTDWLSPVKINDKWGYIDTRTGEVIIQPQFKWALEFSEGLASVQIGKKCGFINKDGQIIIEPQFDDALYFSEGLAEVVINGKSGYIDITGKVVIQPQFAVGNVFSSGLAAVYIGGKYGYIDKTGKLVIQPQFDEAYHFNGDVALVEIAGEGYCIDKTGKFIDE